MSRKQKVTAPPRSGGAAAATMDAPQHAANTPNRRNTLIAGAAGAAALAGIGGWALWSRGDGAEPTPLRPELTRTHAPTLGSAGARVLMVEFIDPACETCAAFYPLVKQLLAEHDGRLRLAMRHVPLHPGVEAVVRALEASRAQDRYWPALEALLTRQNDWVIRHTAYVERALPILASAGVDLARLPFDSTAPELTQRMRTDAADAEVLQVTKTPEYFVGGRQMPSFGRQQLITLVRDEIRRAY